MADEIRVAVDTLGCKLNQAEGELLVRKLFQAGYRVVSADGAADAYILNTCTVTHIADRKARQALRAFKRRSPDALVIATGCYAERARGELSTIPGVRYVLGNGEKARVLEILGDLRGAARPPGTPEERGSKFPPGRRSRAFVKIQDGCSDLCAYCIVPLVRGGKVSLPADSIISQIKELAHAGYREVVLTGTEIGSYHYDGLSLKDLVQRVLAGTDVTRLRLSSLQPPEISPDFISLWKDRRLCHHFHLPLQSGSDRVLRRMRRQYKVEDYRKAVNVIRSKISDAAITTDVIAGFPGETESEFEESYRFCKETHFSRIHVFPYSRRPGTLAAKMPEPVNERVKKERSQKMLSLSKESARSFIQRFLGRRVAVLWEQPAGDGVWSGLTDNYIRVYARCDEDLTNETTEVRLVKLYRDGGWGE